MNQYQIWRLSFKATNTVKEIICLWFSKSAGNLFWRIYIFLFICKLNVNNRFGVLRWTKKDWTLFIYIFSSRFSMSAEWVLNMTRRRNFSAVKERFFWFDQHISKCALWRKCWFWVRSETRKGRLLTLSFAKERVFLFDRLISKWTECHHRSNNSSIKGFCRFGNMGLLWFNRYSVKERICWFVSFRIEWSWNS